MNSRFVLSRLAGLAVLTLAIGADPLLAQEAAEKETGWFFTGEFSGVWTGGNQETFTLGLSATIRRAWERSEFKLEAGGVNTESSLKTRTAVGIGTQPGEFEVQEETQTEKTAEAYFARGRYDYNVSEAFFLFGGADWLRNTFAGIDSRFLMAAGAGNTWTDTERMRFKTDYSFTYTFQEDVVTNPFISSSFPGVRLAYDLLWRLTASTDFESRFIADWNLDNTDDVRIDFTNALPIAISSKLALKPSLKLLWRNDPSLTTVPLFDPAGNDTGESVLVPLEKLDTFLTLALVLDL